MTGPSMMLHYSGWRGEELTEQTLVEHPDGNTWLHTGDEAYITEQGIVHILGRGEIKAYGDKNSKNTWSERWILLSRSGSGA